MPKGNHVFNHYNKTIENALAGYIENAAIRSATGSAVHLTAARTAAGGLDAAALAAHLPKAWPKFREIVGSRQFEHWDEMQDDTEVGVDDANSQAYGRAAGGFVNEVKRIAHASTRSIARPGAYWSEMLKHGFDAEAAARFCTGHQREARKVLVAETQTWVKGPLNALVNTWIQYLKLDADNRK